MGTLPTSFDDLTFAEVAVGARVSSEPLATIGDNSNYVWAAYTPQIVSVPFPTPQLSGSSGADPRADLFVFATPPCADAMDMNVRIYGDNTGGGVPAELTVDLDTDGDSDTSTLAAGGVNEVLLTVTLPAADDVAIISSDEDPAVGWLSFVAYYVDKKGDVVVFTQTASDFRFTLPATELVGNRPVTDEQINRWLRNPRRVWVDRPGMIVCAVENLQAATPRWSQDGASRGLTLPLVCDVRYECDIRFRAYYIGPVGSDLEIVDTYDGTTKSLGVAPDAALPATGGPYVFNEATFTSVSPGQHTFEIYLTGDGVNPCVLYSITGFVE